MRRERAARSNRSAPRAASEIGAPLDEQPPERSSRELKLSSSSTHVPESQRKPFKQSALESHVSRLPPLLPPPSATHAVSAVFTEKPSSQVQCAPSPLSWEWMGQSPYH